MKYNVEVYAIVCLTVRVEAGSQYEAMIEAQQRTLSRTIKCCDKASTIIAVLEVREEAHQERGRIYMERKILPYLNPKPFPRDWQRMILGERRAKAD